MIFGDFLNDGNLNTKAKEKLLFHSFPSFLNSFSVKLFNWFYYHVQLKKEETSVVDYDTFFFPLDKILNWNKIYGKGFIQYQFILLKLALWA